MRARGLCYRRGVRRAIGRLEIGNLQPAMERYNSHRKAARLI